MVVKKRCLLWDWTNSAGPDGGVPKAMDKVNFNGPISSVSNWNAWVPPELHGRAPFRPMIHLERELQGNEWQMIVNSDQPIVHFFNEPERAGITPEKAAKYWFEQVVPTLRKQKRKKLVSPSCAGDDAGSKWIADFMNRVKSDPPDFLGVHYYGTDGNAAIKYIEDMHNKHPHMPVIVSEIASVSRNKNDVYGFTIQLANWMDKTDWVFEYGFFGCMRKLMFKLLNDEPMKW